MPTGLYGELEISKSTGHTPLAAAQFLSSTIIGYISGNCINFVDCTGLKEESNSGQQGDPGQSSETDNASEKPAPVELRPLIASSQITAFALHRRENLVAFAERASTAIKVLKWPSGAVMVGGAGKMEAQKDLSTTNLAFSPDGQYLAAMGSLPSFTIAIWEWRTNTVVCQASPGMSATFLTFDPLDSRRLCSGGGDGGIKFWRIEMGWKRSRLRLVDGKPLPRQAKSQGHLRISEGPTATQHAWTIDEQILCATSSGNELVHYDPTTGECRTYVAAEERLTETDETDIREGDGDGAAEPPSPRYFAPGQLACATVAIEGLYVGGKDGVLRVFSFKESAVIKTIPVAPGQPISRLEFAPDYRTLLVESADGALYLHNVASDRALEIIPSPAPPLITMHGPTSILIAAYENYICLHQVDPDMQQQAEKMREISRITVAGGSHVTCVATSPYAAIAVAGTADGCIRLWDFQKRKLVLMEKVWDAPVSLLSFDSAGRYLAAISAKDPRVALFDVFQRFRFVGHVTVSVPQPHTLVRIEGCAWTLDETNGHVNMFILALPTGTVSFIQRFAFPLDIKGAIMDASDAADAVPAADEPGAEGDKAEASDAGRQDSDDSLSATWDIGQMLISVLVYQIEDDLLDMTIVPSHLSAGRESFYVASSDGMLKCYEGPQGGAIHSGGASDVVMIGKPAYTSKEHDKQIRGVYLHTATSWLTTTSADGTLSFRTLLEPDKVLRAFAHDPFHGGVDALVATANCRAVVTAGKDGLLRLWEWKYSPAGRRAATEVGAVVDRLQEAGEGVLGIVNYSLSKLRAIEDGSPTTHALLPSAAGAAAAAQAAGAAQPSDGTEDEDSLSSAVSGGLHPRLSALRERLLRAIAKNDALSPLERLERDEFILDREERERLLMEATGTVEGVRRSVEEEWLARRVVGNRIKQECWDSMSTIGQSIVSFHADPLTGLLTTVTNYPIRKQQPAEIERVERVTMLRRVQLAVNAATAKKKTVKEVEIGEDAENSGDDADGEPASSATAAAPTAAATSEGAGQPSSDPESLLFSPFELTTNDRRRIQTVLLAHQVHLLKIAFNERFLEVAQQKRDEIARIEERSERARGIMDELGWTGADRIEIVKPVMHDDEVPERVVEVRDDEIPVERFLGAEEQARLAEKQRLDAERARAAAVDNVRDRALTMMMNNSLADRSSEEEGLKAVVQQPDFMATKPAADWTDEERKVAKEYEKKLSVQKEEMEKTRKALETELKKLLAGISELCDAFDTTTLRAGLFNQKLATDTRIYTYELQLIKLNSALLYAEEDESKEAAINQALEECKSEKAMYAGEIPELRKELERVREEHDNATRRDKDVDRAFKKEFGGPGLEAWWEACWRLYRRSGAGEEEEASKAAGVDQNPFTRHQVAMTHAAQQQAQQQAGAAAHVSRPSSPNHPSGVAAAPQHPSLPPTLVTLNPATDAPEGLPAELFQKLADYISRKHGTATDVYTTYVSLHHLQTTITQLLGHISTLSARGATLHAQLVEFQTYRFNQTYDLEICLGGLKQGQVEVVQSPVVTDYGSAVLVGREAVERLNEVICGLGKAKVDALNEMKEYRRGIHALEWETKTLDFSSETLLHKTRDIQLLRVTKHMQEYIRGGDERKQTAEIAALEKRGEYSIKAHLHNLGEKRKGMDKVRRQVAEKRRENEHLDRKLEGLQEDVAERRNVRRAARGSGAGAGDTGDKETSAVARGAEPPLPRKPAAGKDVLSPIHARRRLIDLARSQAQDIAILREEVERLRLRTYPAFPARRSEF
ncbi:Cilia- and flagella-associated protein 43 [Geranomyces variabilis]|uniref:Cilia- and flagella-associated protein 43 n=1 Tax=Geranomyces variabilis TaxID=109894 RepID=A0AAD5XLW4_9FUNG|nr:Cilia- and flagella-associated protein 43 [Geranomyces variabilis]